MNKDNLAYHLDRDHAFGTNIPSQHGGIAWVMLSRQKNIPRFFEHFDAAEHLDDTDRLIYEKQKRIRELPYIVSVAEIKTESFSSERFPGPDDYYRNENFRFSNLDKVEEFLNKMNLSFTDLKWPVDFDFL